MINKDLANGEKLTRRQALNTRGKLMRQHSRIDKLVTMHMEGEGKCEQCLLDIKPFKLDKVTLDLIKIVYANTMAPISAEDFDKATEEKTPEELYESLAKMMTDQSLIKGVLLHHPEQAKQCIDLLQAGTVTGVTSVPKTVKAAE